MTGYDINLDSDATCAPASKKGAEFTLSPACEKMIQKITTRTVIYVCIAFGVVALIGGFWAQAQFSQLDARMERIVIQLQGQIELKAKELSAQTDSVRSQTLQYQEGAREARGALVEEISEVRVRVRELERRRNGEVKR